MTDTRSKGNLTNFTDDPEKISKEKKNITRKIKTMVEPGNIEPGEDNDAEKEVATHNTMMKYPSINVLLQK